MSEEGEVIFADGRAALRGEGTKVKAKCRLFGL
jgi:hypothetical protein